MAGCTDAQPGQCQPDRDLDGTRRYGDVERPSHIKRHFIYRSANPWGPTRLSPPAGQAPLSNAYSALLPERPGLAGPLAVVKLLGGLTGTRRKQDALRHGGGQAAQQMEVVRRGEVPRRTSYRTNFTGKCLWRHERGTHCLSEASPAPRLADGFVLKSQACVSCRTRPALSHTIGSR